MIDHDDVLKARVAGRSVRRIARDHGCSEEAVDAILDQHADVLMTDKALRRALMLELGRLDDYVETFHPKAQAGDPVCGTLCVKIKPQRPAEPRGGADHPSQRTGEGDDLDAEDPCRAGNVMHITVRERELLDKETEPGGFGLTAEDAAEIAELRKARGKGPRRRGADGQIEPDGAVRGTVSLPYGDDCIVRSTP